MSSKNLSVDYPLTVAQRTRKARADAGFKTQEDIAKRLNITRERYAKYETERILNKGLISKFCELTGVSEKWLLTGKDEQQVPMSRRHPDGIASIPQLNIYASAGGGAFIDAEDVMSNWQIPQTVINTRVGSYNGGLRIISIKGDSMPQSMPDGALVFVDVHDTAPSPPGVFIIHDGISLVAKRIDVIPGSRKKLRITSENPAYPSYEVDPEDVRIVGRVRAAMDFKRL